MLAVESREHLRRLSFQLMRRSPYFEQVMCSTVHFFSKLRKHLCFVAREYRSAQRARKLRSGFTYAHASTFTAVDGACKSKLLKHMPRTLL